MNGLHQASIVQPVASNDGKSACSVESRKSKESSAIREMKDIFGNENLTTNQVLYLSVTTLKCTPNNALGRASHGATGSNMTLKVETKDIAIKQDPKNQVSYERTREEESKLKYLLEAMDSFGLGFDRNGIIVHTSPSLSSFYSLEKVREGFHIKLIFHNHEHVLRNVFEKGTFLTKILCRLKDPKTSSIQRSGFCVLTGRIIQRNGYPIFFGYIQPPSIKRSREPTNLNQRIEMTANWQTYTFVGQRPWVIDMYIGKKCKTNEITEDMPMEIVESIPFCMMGMQTYGRSKIHLQFMCVDGWKLLMEGEAFPHPNNDNLFVGLGLPIGKVHPDESISMPDVGVQYFRDKI